MYIFTTTAVGAGAGLLSISPFLILLEIMARKQIPQLPLRHMLGSGLFCLTLSVILSVAGIPAVYSMRLHADVSLIPFADITDAAQPLKSFLLFLPIGALLPLLYRDRQKLSSCVRYGFLFSLAIELLQLFSVHATDITDLLMNTLGTAAGYGIFALFRKLYPPAAAEFSLSEQQTEKLPALFRLEACILTAAAWAAALLFAPAIRKIIWTIFVTVQTS